MALALYVLLMGRGGTGTARHSQMPGFESK
jgi:hypothetical protein